MWLIVISVILIPLLIYKLLFSSTSKKSYWSQYGIREVDGSPAASITEIILGKKDVTDRDIYVYNLLGEDEKFCGMSEMGKKVIFLKDLDLIKKLLIKDFDHFVDRRNIFGGVHDQSVLRKMLPFLEGEKWKAVRSAISPTFTTGKIRCYMDSFNSIGKAWAQMLRKRAKNSPSKTSITIQALPTVNQYATDVIAATVFGMNTGTVQNPNATFAKMANRVARFKQMQVVFGLYFPRLSKFLGLEPLDGEALAFFEKLVNEGLQARMSGAAEKRNDFLQMMAEVNKGELKEEVNEEELDNFEKEARIKNEKGKEGMRQYLTEDVINSQSFMFFFAGFSAPKDFIVFNLYVLAVHQDVQDRVRKEVESVLKKDGTLDYDDVGKLVYMDMVFCEVQRKYPNGIRNERVCTRDYTDTETGLFVPKGTLVVFPSNSIHHDKRYYENPDKFNPEHFNSENKANRNPYAFMPFGFGPRNCLGMRLALVECKAAIAHIVHNFRIEPTEKTPIPIKTAKIPFQRVPPQDLELKLIVL